MGIGWWYNDAYVEKTGAAEGRSVWGGSQAPTSFITNVIFSTVQ